MDRQPNRIRKFTPRRRIVFPLLASLFSFAVFFVFIPVQMSSHTHSRILRIALYGFIAITSIITLGISAAMISVHSARGYPRFYRDGGAPGGSAHDAIIVSFAASLWGIIVGVHRTIEAFNSSTTTTVGHRFSVGLGFLLFVVGAGLLTSWRAWAEAAPLCLIFGRDRPSYNRSGPNSSYLDLGPTCFNSRAKEYLMEPLFGFVWATAALLFIALYVSHMPQQIVEKEEHASLVTHEVAEKV